MIKFRSRQRRLPAVSVGHWHLSLNELSYLVIAERSKDVPDVIPFPPSVFLSALGLGFLLNFFIPLTSYSSVPFRIVGVMLGLAGASLGTWGAYALRQAGTTIRPDRPVTALVVSGPFRFSRNPLYLALTTIYIGITVYAGISWPFITLVPALVMVRWRIVLREEHYLESRFGENYRDYKAGVRRWF